MKMEMDMGCVSEGDWDIAQYKIPFPKAKRWKKKKKIKFEANKKMCASSFGFSQDGSNRCLNSLLLTAPLFDSFLFTNTKTTKDLCRVSARHPAGMRNVTSALLFFYDPAFATEAKNNTLLDGCIDAPFQSLVKREFSFTKNMWNGWRHLAVSL